MVCMIGPPPGAKTSPLGLAVNNVAEGMRKFGVSRLIVQAGGFTKIVGKPSLAEKLMRKIFIWFTNEAAMIAGNDEMAEYLVTQCSDLNWTNTDRACLMNVKNRDPLRLIDYGPGMPSGKLVRSILPAVY